MDETSRCGSEAAGVEVEGCEPCCIVEVDVQPLAASQLRMMSREAYKVGGDSAPLEVGPSLGVEQECVIATIPGDIDEPDGRSVREMSGRPPEAVRPDPVPPAGLGVPAVRASQGAHLIVADGKPPAVFDVVRHATSMSRPRHEEDRHLRRTKTMVLRTWSRDGAGPKRCVVESLGEAGGDDGCVGPPCDGLRFFAR